jgi:hypothetical protein
LSLIAVGEIPAAGIRFAEFPQTKPTTECVAIVACPAAWRDSFQPLHFAAAQHDLVRFDSGNQASNNFRDIASPFPLSAF